MARIESFYLWLTYTSSTGSTDSRLLDARDKYPVYKVIKWINSVDPILLYSSRPAWLKDVQSIRLSIQIMGGDVLYKRTFNVSIKSSCLINQVFQEEYDQATRDLCDTQNK